MEDKKMDDKEKESATDYCETKECVDEAPPPSSHMGWKELYLKEDWWAIYLGIGLMLVTLIAFLLGSNDIKLLVINPGGLKWSSFGQLLGYFKQNIHLYLLQLVFWLVIFSVSTRIMGFRQSQFIPGFIVL